MKSPEATTWRQESARQDQNLRSPREGGVLVTDRRSLSETCASGWTFSISPAQRPASRRTLTGLFNQTRIEPEVLRPADRQLGKIRMRGIEQEVAVVGNNHAWNAQHWRSFRAKPFISARPRRDWRRIVSPIRRQASFQRCDEPFVEIDRDRNKLRKNRLPRQMHQDLERCERK